MRGALLLILALLLAGCSASEPTDDIVVTELATIRGLVIDAAIVPVPDALVHLGEQVATTDAEGRFRLDVDPGAHFVTVNATGFLESQVAVEAHVGEPVDLRIQLEREDIDVPYAIVSEYTGFIACEAIIAFFLESCDADTGQFGEPDNQIFLPAEDRVPDAVQVEVVWSNTQALGSSLTSTWASCTGGDYCDPLNGWTMCQHWGESPLWCRATLDDVTASGTFGSGSNIQAVGHGKGTGVGIGLLVKADCTVCGDPVAPESGVGLVLQQRVNTFAVSFYNMVPAAEWVFAEDGAP